MRKDVAIITAFIVVTAILLVFFAGIEYFGNDEEKVCPECGQTYDRGDIDGNYRSIMFRGMCKFCYMDYQAAR